MELQEPESNAGTLAFLELTKVQNLLIDAFLTTSSRERREGVRKCGFWAFARDPEEQFGRRTAQVKFLNDLYSVMKPRQNTPESARGILVYGNSDKRPGDPQRMREHIHEKFDNENSFLGKLAIEALEIGNSTGYRLSYFLTVEIAKAVRSRVGRPPKDRCEYPDDPILRRNLLIRHSAPVPIPRKAVDIVVDEFIRDRRFAVLILPGSCHSGKTRWMLDYSDRHPASVIFYGFDRSDKDLHCEPVFCRYMAERLASLCSVSKNTKRIASIDSFSKLLTLMSGLRSHLGKLMPVVMTDALDEGDAFTNALLMFMAASLPQGSPALRYVITVRTPSAFLSRLKNIPQSQTSYVFDDRKTVIAFMEDWLRKAGIALPSTAGRLNTMYDKTGSNLQLAIQLLSDVKGDGYAKKTRRGLY